MYTVVFYGEKILVNIIFLKADNIIYLHVELNVIFIDIIAWSFLVMYLIYVRCMSICQTYLWSM